MWSGTDRGARRLRVSRDTVAGDSDSGRQHDGTGHPRRGPDLAVSPDRLCAMVSTAQMSAITGFNITGTTAEMSGDVSVCGYVGITEGYQSTKLFTQYQPTGKVALEYTKARGEAVSGFDNTAVWFQTGGQLLIELGGEAVFGVYVSDVRMHGNDPRGGAMLIAQIAVPELTGH